MPIERKCTRASDPDSSISSTRRAFDEPDIPECYIPASSKVSRATNLHPPWYFTYLSCISRPWNDYTCRFPELYPNIHLTFSFGTTLSRTAIPAMLNYIERDIRSEIADGHRDQAIFPFNVIRREDLEMEFWTETEMGRRITFGQIFEVVELLKRCGFERGYREEMWGVIFDGAGRTLGEVGLVYTRSFGPGVISYNRV